MAKTKNYGRQHSPEYYYEGKDLKIAQSIYNGETYLLDNLLKEEIDRINPKGMNFLLYSIYADNEEALLLLLEKGGDANVFTEVKSISSEFWHKMTPISIAAKRPKISYIKTLLKYGANINDNRATPALLNAIMRNDRIMVDLLLDNGADVNIQQKITKDNVLTTAVRIFDHDMVNHLLDRGANPMLRDVSGVCLAYKIQKEIEEDAGSKEYKKTIADLKKRLEGMGVVFPIEKIPPKEEEEEIPASSKNEIREEVKTDTATSSTGTEQTDNLPQQNRKKTWSALFDDDDA